MAVKLLPCTLTFNIWLEEMFKLNVEADTRGNICQSITVSFLYYTLVCEDQEENTDTGLDKGCLRGHLDSLVNNALYGFDKLSCL